MYNGGVPVLAGYDANLFPYVPANPPFGLSLHEELELLVAASVFPVNAIRGATSLAALTFRLYDRGSIAVSPRANPVLLSADPTVDIRNSRPIEKVWIQGVESDPSNCEVRIPMQIPWIQIAGLPLAYHPVQRSLISTGRTPRHSESQLYMRVLIH